MTAETVRWSVQTKRGHVWCTTETGKAPSNDGRTVGLAALAAVLMTVDHDRDLDDRRVLVQMPDGLALRMVADLSEVDLAQYLRERGYYERCNEEPLAAFFPEPVRNSLPLWLLNELARLGAPRRAAQPGQYA
ncbi:hypothetical protein ACFV10_28650 [Streptomyces cyaneofuscatus]|uniref:hypothetical protein n=1 Tax=Streptomyces cyaneofuscatus TaxID=66883 RepID=UPI0036D17859